MSEWEDRARAIKAFRIARALRRADLPAADWRDAPESIRDRAAEQADVRAPSDRTWQIAVDLLEQWQEAD